MKNKARLLLFVCALLALAGLGVTAYLTVQSLSGGAVAGCGGDSGCAQVLASRWSKLGPVPVSLLAALTYLAVLVGIGLRWNAKRDGHPLGDGLLWLAAPLLVIGGLWFVGLQIVAVDALCPYCMASHGIGFVLAGLVVFGLLRDSAVNPGPLLLVAALAGAGLIAGQLVLPAPQPTVQRAPNPFVDEEGDTVIDGKRYLSLFGGELQFVLEDMPYLGDPRAKQVVVVLFDYACPHCRELHELLVRAIDRDPGRFILVPLPLSIYEGQSRHIASDLPRFADSAERALLSMAVAAVDREQWRAFDCWLFAMEGGDFPRSAKDARAKAEALVGPEVLGEQLIGDQRDRHLARLQRNIDLIGQLPEAKRFIPVTTTPGAPEHLTTRYDNIEVLYELLDQAKPAINQPPADQ